MGRCAAPPVERDEQEREAGAGEQPPDHARRRQTGPSTARSGRAPPTRFISVWLGAPWRGVAGPPAPWPCALWARRHAYDGRQRESDSYHRQPAGTLAQQQTGKYRESRRADRADRPSHAERSVTESGVQRKRPYCFAHSGGRSPGQATRRGRRQTCQWQDEDHQGSADSLRQDGNADDAAAARRQAARIVGAPVTGSGCQG